MKRSGNIVLVGFMGSGKTSVGLELARRLGWEFVDTDALVERKAGRSIAEIFAQEGERTFRLLESEAVREAASRRGAVIATGGGAVLSPENREVLRSSGIVVFLNASADVLYRRVLHETHRPLLRVPDPVGRIRELLEARLPFYVQADLVVETDGHTVEEVADEVLRHLSLDGER